MKPGGPAHLRRMMGLVARTRNFPLAARLFRLGDQGRAVSLSLVHLKAIESLLGLRSGKLRKIILELTEDKPFFDHINSKLLEAEEKLSAEKSQGTVGLFDYGPLLYALVRCVRPSAVVETGVASGTSSAYILKALEDEGEGKLYSIDLPQGDQQDPEYATAQWNRRGAFGPTLIPTKLKTGYAVPEKLKSHWQLILGDAATELPKLLKQLGTIDIFFHDSKHSYEHMMFEFQIAYPHLRSGGYVLSDDVAWNSSFVDFARQVSRPCHSVPIGILVK